MKHVSSAAMENMCQTLLEFQLDVDVDIAATDVREKLDAIELARLPIVSPTRSVSPSRCCTSTSTPSVTCTRR